MGKWDGTKENLDGAKEKMGLDERKKDGTKQKRKWDGGLWENGMGLNDSPLKRKWDRG